MPPDKEDLKAKLLAKAEAEIEAMLSDPKVNPKMSLSEMERVVGELGSKLNQQVMQELVNTSQGETEERCPECGGRLRYKGQRSKRIESVRGEIEAKRDYYTCSDCGAGFFPPG